MARTARNADIPSLGALDRAAGDLSRQLAQALREAVRRGDVHPGDALPSTRLLATSLQVARGTVVDAYAQLIAEGFLESRGGAGTDPMTAPGVPGATFATTAASRNGAFFRERGFLSFQIACSLFS